MFIIHFDRVLNIIDENDFFKFLNKSKTNV